MKKLILSIFILALALTLTACGGESVEPTPAPAEPAPTATPEPTPEPTPTPAPEHSELYVPGLEITDLIRYFNEVTLDAEFVNGGDASLVQKWDSPINYVLLGDYTEEDKAIVEEMAAFLNTIDGFPGMQEAEEEYMSDLAIHFCTQEEMVNILGDNFWTMDGGVTFWYDDANRIYDATICILSDLTEPLRRSVILEEIYNGLGPVQDSDLRTDSIIWSGYASPQNLTIIDETILKLLYNEAISCGMSAEECEVVIRALYW